MTSGVTQECSACTIKTTQKCSGCLMLFFCSKECQRLVWHTHKILCQNGGVFTVASLSSLEVKLLSERKDEPSVESVHRYGGKGKSMVELFEHLRLYSGGWQFLMDHLSDPSSASFPEPQRTVLICLLRSRLLDNATVIVVDTASQSERRLAGYCGVLKELSLNAWHHVAQSVTRFAQHAWDPTLYPSSPNIPFFSQALPFFRQMLIAHTLSFLYWDRGYQDKKLRELALLAFSRAKALIHSLILPSGFEFELRFFVDRTMRSVDE
ncbi:hypothetical protein JCM8097_000986 [Rhodosporidiobolus ruineniae]